MTNRRFDELATDSENAGNSNPYRTGLMSVSIPSSHQAGRLERPDDEESHTDQQRYFSIQSNILMERDAWVAAIENDLEQCDNPEILIFVHGTNNTFQNAALRTAQLSLDSDFQGVSICFAWPSHGALSLDSYHEDQALAMASVEGLHRMLTLLSERIPNAKRHVVAHSLGCRMIMTLALAMTATETDLDPLIDQLIFAAPDIDLGVFESFGLAATKSISARLTIYVTPRDAALQVSADQNGARPRVGTSLGSDETEPQVRVVDVTGALTLKNALTLNHMYVVDNQVVLEHVRSVLNDELTGLRENTRIE